MIVITRATSGIGLSTTKMAAVKGTEVAAAGRNEQARYQLQEDNFEFNSSDTIKHNFYERIKTAKKRQKTFVNVSKHVTNVFLSF